MPETISTTAAVPPHVQLIEMATACWTAVLLHAAAKFGLADHLADGPKSAQDLAGPTKTHAPSLHRLMRTLASLGVLTEDAQHRFRLTPLGEALKTGAPGSARATLLTFGGDFFWRALEYFPYSVETGKTGFEKAMGQPIFDWLGQHPEKASLFSETMVGFHGREPAAVAEAYDFAGVNVLVDVGGATGNMITTILARHPNIRGVLFDLPQVEKDARDFIQSRGLTDRIMVQAGSFFDTAPAGGDAYLLSHIIHDWSEDQCITILLNCRKAMKPDGRLLIVEMVLPSGDTPHPGKLLDMIMLAIPGGQERTEEEYRTLLSKAGFRLTRVVPTASAVSVIEAVVA
jgi:hypothetical protein